MTGRQPSAAQPVQSRARAQPPQPGPAELPPEATVALTVGGRRLLVGSFNLDPFSLANLEALVEVEDAKVVEQRDAWIGDHFARSRAMTSVETSSRLQRWLLDPLGRLIARLAEAISRVVASPMRRLASRDRFMSAGSPRRHLITRTKGNRP